MKHLINVLGHSIFGNTVFFCDFGIAQSVNFMFEKKRFTFFGNQLEYFFNLFRIGFEFVLVIFFLYNTKMRLLFEI